MDFSDVFRVVNLVTGVFVVLGGISQFFGGFGVYVRAPFMTLGYVG